MEKIEFFFNDFLNRKDYQKIRKGKKTADLIFNSIQKQIKKDNQDIKLLALYKERTKKYPNSITITNKEPNTNV